MTVSSQVKQTLASISGSQSTLNIYSLCCYRYHSFFNLFKRHYKFSLWIHCSISLELTSRCIRLCMYEK